LYFAQSTPILKSESMMAESQKAWKVLHGRTETPLRAALSFAG
jgi:hypothetical protein